MKLRCLNIFVTAFVSACATAPPYQNYPGKTPHVSQEERRTSLSSSLLAMPIRPSKRSTERLRQAADPFVLARVAIGLEFGQQPSTLNKRRTTLIANLEAGAQYELRGTLRGIRIIVQLVPTNGGSTQASPEFPLARIHERSSTRFHPYIHPRQRSDA